MLTVHEKTYFAKAFIEFEVLKQQLMILRFVHPPVITKYTGFDLVFCLSIF